MFFFSCGVAADACCESVAGDAVIAAGAVVDVVLALLKMWMMLLLTFYKYNKFR